jgi:hypothetical protein
VKSENSYAHEREITVPVWFDLIGVDRTALIVGRGAMSALAFRGLSNMSAVTDEYWG